MTLSSDFSFRSLRHDEVDDAMALLDEALLVPKGSTASEHVLEQAQHGSCLGAFDAEGQLVAYVQWMDRYVNVHGRRLRCGFSGPGATRPGVMGAGLMTQLVRHTLREMAEARCVFAMLETPVFGWHQRNGYEVCTAARRYDLPLNALRGVSFPEKGDLLRNPGIEVCSGIYEEAARQHNMSLVRDDSWWRTRIVNLPERRTVGWSASSGDGYAVFVLVPLGGFRWRVDVVELFALGPDAYLGLIRYLSDFSRAEAFRWDAPADDVLVPVLAEATLGSVTWQPDMMARIVQVPQALSLALDQAGPGSPVLVTVQDDIVVANEGSWLVGAPGPDGSPIVRVASADDVGLPEVVLDVRFLCPVLLGAMDVEPLAAVGAVREVAEGGLAGLKRLANRRRSPMFPETMF